MKEGDTCIDETPDTTQQRCLDMDAFAAQALGLFTTLHRGAQTNNERAHCGLNTRNTPHTHNDTQRHTHARIHINIYSVRNTETTTGTHTRTEAATAAAALAAKIECESASNSNSDVDEQNGERSVASQPNNTSKQPTTIERGSRAAAALSQSRKTKPNETKQS